MRYVVTWEPIWHQGLDFLFPGAGQGHRLCADKEAADAFAEKLRREGVRVGEHAGQVVFGSELKITVAEEETR